MTDSCPLRISSPGDLVALLPYLVGFVPHDSLVGVWIEHGRVRLTARMDLDSPRAAVSEQMAAVRERLPEADVALIAWEGERRRARRVLRWAAAAMPVDRVIDVILCDGERWWSLDCADPTCCPTEGTAVDATSPAVLDAVLLGRAPAADRSAVVRRVGGPAPEEWERLRSVADACEDRLGPLDEVDTALLARRLLEDLERSRELPDEAGCVELALLLARSDEAAVAAATSIAAGRASEVLPLWERVVAVAVPEVAAAATAVLGIASWLAGEGALLTECCRRVELADPDHPLLDVLQAAALAAMPPAAWEELRGFVTGGGTAA